MFCKDCGARWTGNVNNIVFLCSDHTKDFTIQATFTTQMLAHTHIQNFIDCTVKPLFVSHIHTYS